MKRTPIAWLAAAMTALAGCATGGAGWTTLVDGTKGLDNFNRVGDAQWSASDGAIQASAGGKDPGYLVTKNSYKDFMIRAEFWASDDANIFDQRPDPTYGTGAIVKVAKVDPMPKAGGKWNTYEITVQGKRLVLVLNGVKTVDVEDGKLASGPVALQWGRGTIKWRKVEIKAL